jgi:hypothetical protein
LNGVDNPLQYSRDSVAGSDLQSSHSVLVIHSITKWNKKVKLATTEISLFTRFHNDDSSRPVSEKETGPFHYQLGMKKRNASEVMMK